MKHKFEINREIVFSTSHISKKCDEWLHLGSWSSIEKSSSLSVDIINGGFRIHAMGSDFSRETGFPELDCILKAALNAKCKWVILDRDGPKYKIFQEYDW